MSVLLIKEPQLMIADKADQLKVGTWFLDQDDHIHVIALDDRTNERRLVCLSASYRPFILDIPIQDFRVEHVLPHGTVLQVSSADSGQGVVE